MGSAHLCLGDGWSRWHPPCASRCCRALQICTEQQSAALATAQEVRWALPAYSACWFKVPFCCPARLLWTSASIGPKPMRAELESQIFWLIKNNTDLRV